VGVHVPGHHVFGSPPHPGHVAASQVHRSHGPGGPSRVSMPAIHHPAPSPSPVSHSISGPSTDSHGAGGHASGSGGGKK
jgi:hypothetical protein